MTPGNNVAAHKNLKSDFQNNKKYFILLIDLTCSVTNYFVKSQVKPRCLVIYWQITNQQAREFVHMQLYASFKETKTAFVAHI